MHHLHACIAALQSGCFPSRFLGGSGWLRDLGPEGWRLLRLLLADWFVR